MTHAELSRLLAMRSVEGFLSALERYSEAECDARNRYIFVKGDGVARIQNDPDLPKGLLIDLTRLRDALMARNAEEAETTLHRLGESDYPVPFDVKTDYRARYVELFNRAREYVEISTVALPSVDGQQHWLKVSECAELLLNDVDGLNVENARARVSFAASKNKFRTNGKKGNARRVDRDSFSTWRLKQRERDLDADNEAY